MSESKERARPQDIRVIDRRMFTPDGRAREPDAPREDGAPAHPATPVGPSPKAASSGPSPRAAAGRPSAGPPPEDRETQMAAAHFRNLLLNLATTAAANLGEIPNPFSQQTEVDLEGARQVIDLIQALQIKTRGNLNAEESQLVESLLYDLKTKFVSLQNKAAKRS